MFNKAEKSIHSRCSEIESIGIKTSQDLGIQTGA